MNRQDLTITVPWMTAGTDFFLDRLGALDDAEFAAPSALPGWTNAHVVAHVARNADALGRLIRWARTGVEAPMYSSPEDRNAEIERDAQQPPYRLRADVRTTAAELADAIAGCDERTLSAQVRSAKGRPIPAAEVPWMRVREVWLHATDLGGAGATVGDLPTDVAATLLDDATGTFTTRGDAPALRLADPATGRVWTVGDGDLTEVSGRTQDLLAWLVGRSTGAGLDCAGPLPDLPAWL